MIELVGLFVVVITSLNKDEAFSDDVVSISVLVTIDDENRSCWLICSCNHICRKRFISSRILLEKYQKARALQIILFFVFDCEKELS